LNEVSEKRLNGDGLIVHMWEWIGRAAVDAHAYFIVFGWLCGALLISSEHPKCASELSAMWRRRRPPVTQFNGARSRSLMLSWFAFFI
jgi:hypothetical protein